MYAARRHSVQTDSDLPAGAYCSVEGTQGEPLSEGSDPVDIMDLEEVMYWHNATHIHSWFVENVQGDRDASNGCHVPPDALRELLITCENVIENSELVDGMMFDGVEFSKDDPNGRTLLLPGKVIKDPTIADELLPVQRVFSLGDEVYDERYLAEVSRTRDWLKDTLDGPVGADCCIYYFSN